MTRIGIYPGTFDPVHKGHISFALEAAKACRLDKVYLLPEPKPREKTLVTPMSYRSEMLGLAVQDHSELECLELPFDQFSVKYTLPVIRSEFRDCKLTMLLGSDVVQTFTYRWEGLDDLLNSVELAVGLRTGSEQSSVKSVLEQVGSSAPFYLISTNNSHVTASGVRSDGLSELVDPKVAAYIQMHNLY